MSALTWNAFKCIVEVKLAALGLMGDAALFLIDVSPAHGEVTLHGIRVRQTSLGLDIGPEDGRSVVSVAQMRAAMERLGLDPADYPELLK